MENASKALLMAGSVLLALLVIGALLLMFNNISSYQESKTQNTRDAQIIEFNNQFSTFNRDNIRGNELYSLLNRVVDYNKRKTIEGDEGGIEIGYKPMTIKFSLKSDNGRNYTDFSIDATQSQLFTTNDYIVEKAANTFESYILSQIQSIENTYGKEVLTKLTTGITKIFIDDDESDQRKEEAKIAFNNIVKNNKKITSYNQINEGSQIRKQVYKYYEYVQFKRAHFDCVKCEYDKDTGRIILMEFKFNGKIE